MSIDFETHRPRLRALAYRMLGSRSEAEDVVQDAWLRWQAADRRTRWLRACLRSFHGVRCPAKAVDARRKPQPGWWPGEDLQRRRRCFCGATLRARQQTATLVVARLAQAASMGCGRRLDRDGLLPCVPHEKIVNRFYTATQ